MRSKRLLSKQKPVKNKDFYKGSLHRKGTYECDGVKIVISSPLFSNNVKNQYRPKSKSMRKYAGRTIAREKQNYKTSKIA